MLEELTAAREGRHIYIYTTSDSDIASPTPARVGTGGLPIRKFCAGVGGSSNPPGR